MKIPTAHQLPSGSWFVRLRIDGKSIPITASTERESIAQAMAYKAGIQRIRRSPEKVTLGQAYDDYIRDHPELSPSAVAGYKRLQSRACVYLEQGYQPGGGNKHGGKLLKADYLAWRKGKMVESGRLKALVDTLTADYVNSDKI